MSRKRRVLALVSLLAYGASYSMSACAAPTAVATNGGSQSTTAGARYVRSEHRYRIPDAILSNPNGKSFSLAQELAADGFVVLNFISTSCTGDCGSTSDAFTEAQRLLGLDARRLRFISITTDPRRDTAMRLRSYAERYQPRPNWLWLTGRGAEIEPVLRAFDYTGNSSRPIAVTYLHAGPRSPWLRLDGPLSGADLVAEYRKLTTR